MRGEILSDEVINILVENGATHPFTDGGRKCRVCAYDLRGNMTGRCPECGHRVIAHGRQRSP